MALIKCPECGRENVSDSAEVCPDCGYGIKAYFDQIRQEKMQEQKRIEKELDTKKRIEAVSMPEQPKFSRVFILYLILVFIVVSWLALYATPTINNREELSVIDWIFWIVYLIGTMIIPLFFMYLPYYKKRVKDYELACQDFEAYQRQVIQAEDKAIADALVRERREAMKPECPYCHSHNTTKISSFDKTLLQEKRIYQWHCNRCQSDF